MKKYIKASETSYLNGAYLLTKDGELLETVLHAPSTTFINRGLMFLSPTDADLLFRLHKISEYDMEIILLYSLNYFLANEKHSSSSLMYTSEFINWAELKFAPTARSIFMKHLSSNVVPENIDTQFSALNKKWYTWLQNNFVKLSVINKVAEFRITSDDAYDWNDVIIDDCILEYDWAPGTRYNILKEDASGYRAYFFNATLDDILENDNLILSSTLLDRKIINGALEYGEFADTYNQLAEIYRKDAEGWMFGKDSRGSLWIGTASEVYEYSDDTPENFARLSREWEDNSFAKELKI